MFQIIWGHNTVLCKEPQIIFYFFIDRKFSFVI